MPKSDIKWAVECISETREVYATCQDYYDGDQPLLFATEKFRNTFGNLFKEFADNLCPTVVDAVADRLKITGWDGDDAKQAEKLWKKWRLTIIANQVHRTAPMKGDAYVIVWPDKLDVVRFWPQEPDMCCVEYDEEDDPNKIVKAAKAWQDGDRYRLTLYYPDMIEKYETNGTSTELTSKEYRWDLIGEVDNPWGAVPMFHFGNRAEVGALGVSELANVIPLQDALNKAVLDMMVAMEFVAMPQRYATGLQLEVDENTGKPKTTPFTPGVDRIWTAAGDVTFGEFAQADITKFIGVQDSIRLEISRVSGTPPHFLSLETQMPSGEALKVAEGRLIKKVERTTESFDPKWIDMMVLAGEMDGAALDPEKFVPVWGAASPHNPLLDAETQLVKKQVGLSEHQSLRELGYTDEQIDRMDQEKMEEALAQADLAQAMAPPQLLGPNGQPISTVDPSGKPTAFNRNGAPGQASKPSKGAPPYATQAQPKFGGVPVPLPRAGRGQWSDS